MRSRPLEVAGPLAGQRLHSRSERLEGVADLLDLAGPHGFVWLAGGRGLVTRGVAARVPLGTGPGRLARAAAAARALLATAGTAGGPGPVVVGALPFDEATPGELVVPALAVRQEPDGQTWVTRTRAGRAPAPGLAVPRPQPETRRDWPRVTAVRVRQDGAAWRRAVGAALAEIAAGRLAKVVLAREVVVEADRPFPRAAILRRLRERAPGAYLYADGGFVGATPELLVARQGREATCHPMAGTVPRGGSPAEQARREARLAASAKDAAEHRFVVDDVVAALRAAGGEVEVEPTGLVRQATVTHLATRVRARLPDPAPTALDLVARLHPTAAVAGTPRAAALALLAELEPFSRGAYAGPVGWMDASGDGEWAVALRCAELDGTSARLLTGAGIVAGSDPAAEWAETEAKVAAMLDVLTSG